MKRRWVFVGLVVAVVLLPGCLTPPPLAQFRAWVDPPQGYVPYDAKIVCTTLRGTYTYQLPDGSQSTSTANEFDVTIDALEWEATVTWTNGDQVLTDTAAAHGTNDRPTILPPRINGIPHLWRLEPRLRTLIDFTRSVGSGVDYAGEWRVVDLRVECEFKQACQHPVGDSIFCPPYEEGRYHALFGNHLHENACIVYPTYTGESAPDGLPYAPAPEDGYTVDAAQNHNVFFRVTFPAQTAQIHVTVEDDWGRLTSASFEIPVMPLLFKGAGVPPTDYTDVVFYVAGANSGLFHYSTCRHVCSISPADRVYFTGRQSAMASGRRPCPECFGSNE